MAGALAAPPRRRAPALIPLFRITLRSLWSPSSDADPAAAAAANNSTASNTRPQQKKLHRLASVIDAVNERKLPPELRDRANAIRSETDIVNVVEQRIWRSMEEGHFENLPGKGKPLDLSTNPHADPAENTLYRILSKNGCAPEWVELNKEIRSTIAEWRSALKNYWANRTDHDDSKRLDGSEALQAQMNEINKKVLRYNLIVPFGRQMFGLKWEKELAKLEEKELAKLEE